MQTNAITIAKLERVHATDWHKLRLQGVQEFPLAFLPTLSEVMQSPDASQIAAVESGELWGAFDQTRLIGFCGFRIPTLSRIRHKASIGPFYITPEYHGQGAGQALITQIIHHARAQKVQILELYVDTENHRAIRFYEKAGFVLHATLTDSVRADDMPRDDHLYRLAL